MTKNVDTVSELVGDWGPWQLRTVSLIYLCKIPAAWFMACLIFTAPIPEPGEVSCYHPETESLSNQNTEMWSQDNDHKELVSNDFCMRLNRTYEDVDGETKYESVPCTSFQFNTPFETTVTKFNLVCSRSILISTSQFFHLFGVLTGGLLAMKLMEYISPRKLMLHGMVIQIFAGCFAGLVSNHELHMLLRYVASVCCAQMYTAGQVIFTDITGNKHRTTSLCFFETFWSLGVILLPVIAYIDPNWSSISLMISLPTILYIPLWWFIADTPRWYLRKGRVGEAAAIIKHAISVNNTKQASSAMTEPELEQHLMKYMESSSKEEPPAKWHSLWNDRGTVVPIIAVHFAWAVYVTNYSGMLLNVRSFGREHLSFNTSILGISEMIGVFIGYFLIMNSKRKWQYAGMFNVFAGFFASIGYFYPSSLSPDQQVGLLMLTAIIPKMAVSCSQSILFACTTELVKPEKRKILVFSCIVWARIWLLTAPFIGGLRIVHQLLPLSVFGVLSAIGGIAICLISTPKTNSPSLNGPRRTNTEMMLLRRKIQGGASFKEAEPIFVEK